LIIDTHHHILPDFFWEETENAHAPVGGLAPLRWSKEATLSFMDDAGIDVAVVSLSTPGVHTGDSHKARNLARRCNDFAADLIQARCLPGGVVAFKTGSTRFEGPKQWFRRPVRCWSSSFAKPERK
jgi:hypothetical protein